MKHLNSCDHPQQKDTDLYMHGEGHDTGSHGDTNSIHELARHLLVLKLTTKWHQSISKPSLAKSSKFTGGGLSCSLELQFLCTKLVSSLVVMVTLIPGVIWTITLRAIRKKWSNM